MRRLLGGSCHCRETRHDRRRRVACLQLPLNGISLVWRNNGVKKPLLGGIFVFPINTAPASLNFLTVNASSVATRSRNVSLPLATVRFLTL